jgi:hypothetical protein
MTEPRIDAEFVAEWAAAYPTGADGRVLEVVHPAVRERGYFTATEAENVIKWKSNRTITFLRRNDPQDVEVITGMALKAPERLPHRVLGVLHGVGVPVASAFLTVARPDTFTVIDILAVQALRRHGEWGATWPPYVDYLVTCRALAERCGTDLRTLDRALWAWGKAHPA